MKEDREAGVVIPFKQNAAFYFQRGNKYLADEDLPKAEQYLRKLVKAADKFSALIKCIEEVRMGNNEFLKAKSAVEESLRSMQLPALEIFMEEYLPAYYLTLDELG